MAQNAKTVPVRPESIPVSIRTIPVGEGQVPVGIESIPVSFGTILVGVGWMPLWGRADPTADQAAAVENPKRFWTAV